MPSKIHLICKDQLGLRCIDLKSHLYTSSAWKLTPEEAEALAGGMVYFHQTKARPSYFGGDIQSIDLAPPAEDEPEVPGRPRHVITLKSTLAARGAAWDKSGKSLGQLWSSGVIPQAQAQAQDAEQA